MKIGIIGPTWLPIPPPGYGGSELVTYNLVEGLVDLGHDVTLFASAGSKTRAKLRPVTDKSLLEIKGRFDFSDNSFDLLNASQAISSSGEFDVLHNMVGYQLMPFVPFSKCPIVTTSHSSVKEYDTTVDHFSDANYISISNSQRRLHPKLNYIATVYHGIDTSKYIPDSNTQKDHLVFISRIMPEKGVHLAISAAEQAGEKLIIAGIIDDRDKEYFENEIKPHLREGVVDYIGPVNEAEKILLLQGAKGFIFPTQWDEAFGLVVVEALACGVPVIVSDKGAMPEIVTQGEVGFIVNSVDDMATAIANVSDIQREACRELAVQKFSRATMAKNYELVYKSLIR